MAVLRRSRPTGAGALPPWPHTHAPAPRPRRRALGVLAALGIAAAGGALTGTVLTATTTGAATETPPPVTAPTTAPPPSTQTVHTQDINLCTTYALVAATEPSPSTTGTDLTAGNAMMRIALLENPDASADVRQALTDDTIVSLADIAYWSKVRAGGLVEPTWYGDLPVQEIYNRAWAICGLDQ